MLLIYWHEMLWLAEVRRNLRGQTTGPKRGLRGSWPRNVPDHPPCCTGCFCSHMNERHFSSYLFQTHSDTWVSLHCLIFFLPWAYLSQVLDKKLRCWFATVTSSVAWVYFPGWMSTSSSGRGLPLWCTRRGESADFAVQWFWTTFCRCVCHCYRACI